MGAKKDEYRFTIQFSSEDSRHLQVAGILNRQGRRKAQYLVNAVLCYENGMDGAAQEQPPNYHAIEAIVNQILAGKVLSDTQPAKPPAPPKRNVSKSEEITFEDAADILGEDGMAAIADTLSAFRKK